VFSQVAIEAFAALFALVASIITLGVTKFWETRPLRSLDSGIREAITGTWRGKLHMSDHPWKVLRAEFTLSLKASRKIVTGNARLSITTIRPGKDTQEEFTNEIVLRGGFFADRFVRLEYRNAKHAILQFGSLMLRLSDDAADLNGKFIGYGAFSKTMLTGSLDLTKAL
jgi:hypothetical protein